MIPSYLDRDAFLHHLRQSQLLTSEQLRAVGEQFGHVADSHELARALVAAGTLTHFQAKMLLKGRTSGFFLGGYRILDVLGQGGMGRVYRAQHETMGRTVALKVLAPSVMNNARVRRLFLREVQAAARLSHPNIVTAYDAGLAAGRHYLAMEFVNGPNLRQLVQRNGPLPIGLACEVVRQAALGLQHAHEKGMVHRDIKPANLLLRKRDRRYEVKILDFGLARLNVPAEQSSDGAQTIISSRHAVMGTPDYVSPEQARDLHGVDIRSDLYSLGCTFYCLLTGQPPFPGGSSLDKLIRHSAEAPAFVESLRPEVPMAVADIVHRLLAKDPAERHATPLELVQALTPFARNRGTSRRPSPTPSEEDLPVLSPTADTAPHPCSITHVGDQTATGIASTSELPWGLQWMSRFVETALKLFGSK